MPAAKQEPGSRSQVVPVKAGAQIQAFCRSSFYYLGLGCAGISQAKRLSLNVRLWGFLPSLVAIGRPHQATPLLDGIPPRQYQSNYGAAGHKLHQLAEKLPALVLFVEALRLVLCKLGPTSRWSY